MSRKKEKEDQRKPNYQDLLTNKKLVDVSKARLDEIKDFVENNEIVKNEVAFKTELNAILLEIVEKGSTEQLENYLHWFHNELLVTTKNTSVWKRWKDEIKAENGNVNGTKSLNGPLIEASLKNDYHKVLIFLRHGFRINDSMFDDYDEWQNQCVKPAKEKRKSWIKRQFPSINPEKVPKTSSQVLVNFHASSTPAYLMGRYVHDMEKLDNLSANLVPSKELRDPVSDAFKNAYIAENWMSRIENDKNKELHSIQKLREILETSQTFILEMLDQCKTRKEAALFFSYDTSMEKYHIWDKDDELANKFPRLSMAIKQKYSEIVTHENSQFILGMKWVTSDHTGQIVKGYNSNLADRGLRFIVSVILFPVYCLCFFMRVMSHSDYYETSASLSFEEDEGDTDVMKQSTISWMSRIGHVCNHFTSHFSIPVNRYVGSFISHCFFLGWITRSMTYPYKGDKDGLQINWPDYLLLIWSTGHVCKLAHDSFCYYKSFRRNHHTKIRKTNVFWQSFNAICYLLIFSGCITKFIGAIKICGPNVIFNQCHLFDSGKTANEREKLLLTITRRIYYDCIGWGYFFNFIKSLHWTQHTLHLGTLVTTFKKVIIDCLKMTVLFYIFMTACSRGIYFLLKNDNCNEGVRYNETIHQYHDGKTTKIIGTYIEQVNMVKVQNKFQTEEMASETAQWSILEPGHPQYTGCRRFMWMWWVYQWICVVIILNLLIAIMNNTYNKIYQNKIKEWQHARTEVWVSYFNKKFSLPVPFNMLEYMVWLLVQVIQKIWNIKKYCHDTDIESNNSNIVDITEEQFNSLICKLTKKYLENKTN